MANELQVRYATMIDARMRANLVTLDGGANPVFNTRYEGDPKAGAVKIPVRDAEVKVQGYDKVTGAPLTTSSTSYLTVTDFNDVSVNELIDGYDAAAVPDNIVADRLESAGYAGQAELDTDSLETLSAQGTGNADTTATVSTNAYDRFVDARTTMSNANVPAAGRWAIVTPTVYGELLKDTTNFIKQGDLSQQLVEQGYIGMIAGFAVKESSNLPDGVEYICGHADWCHRIREWVVLPHVQDLNGDGMHIGASAVQGRWVYKHKVSKAAAVYVKFINSLTITSVAGATAGTTAATVLPALTEGNTYKFKTSTAATIPQYGAATTSGYTAWNGTADITAVTGNKLVIVEVDANGLVVKAGSVVVASHA